MLIPINEIYVADHANEARARKTFGDINELAGSLRDHGLMHPIVLEKINSEGTGELYKYRLIAGERRIRAALLLGWITIESSVREPSDAIKRKSMELEENIKRLDMSWPEKIEAMRQLHELKQSTYGERTNDPNSEAGWGTRETAKLLNISQTKVSKDINLANLLRDNPEIAKKVGKLPQHAALRLTNQLLDRQKAVDTLELSGKPVPGAELFNGNCIDLIDNVPDGSIKLLLTDPPFAEPDIVKAANTDTAAYNINQTNVSDSVTMIELFKKLIPKLAKKLAIGAHVYIFSGMGEMYSTQMLLLKQAGFIIDSLPLIWDKGMVSVVGRDYHYMSTYQAILFGHNQKQTRSLWKPIPNVLRVKALAHQNRAHPLQLPSELLDLLIKNSTDPGDVVLDCFAGSGAILKSAVALRRQAIGFELDPANYMRALDFIKGDNNDVQAESPLPDVSNSVIHNIVS